MVRARARVRVRANYVRVRVRGTLAYMRTLKRGELILCSQTLFLMERRYSVSLPSLEAIFSYLQKYI